MDCLIKNHYLYLTLPTKEVKALINLNVSKLESLSPAEFTEKWKALKNVGGIS